LHNANKYLAFGMIVSCEKIKLRHFDSIPF